MERFQHSDDGYTPSFVDLLYIEIGICVYINIYKVLKHCCLLPSLFIVSGKLSFLSYSKSFFYYLIFLK